MKQFILFVVAGIVVSLGGFLLLVVSSGFHSTELVPVGLALMFLGAPVLLVVGLLVAAFRRPTGAEIARQDPRKMKTWHFRPLGLLLFLAVVGAFVGLQIWLEPYAPEWFGVRDQQTGYRRTRWSPASLLFAVVIVGLLAIPRVRNLVFYRKPSVERGQNQSAADKEPENKEIDRQAPDGGE